MSYLWIFVDVATRVVFSGITSYVAVGCVQRGMDDAEIGPPTSAGVEIGLDFHQLLALNISFSH